MLLLYMINLIKHIKINCEHLRAFLRNGEIYQIGTGDDISILAHGNGYSGGRLAHAARASSLADPQ